MHWIKNMHYIMIGTVIPVKLDHNYVFPFCKPVDMLSLPGALVKLVFYRK